jgi:hypothetical protein
MNEATVRKMELIEEAVELNDSNETVNVYANEELRIFTVGESGVTEYALTGEQDEIAKNHRQEILEYRLCKVTDADEVSLADIFMHGKYVKKIK